MSGHTKGPWGTGDSFKDHPGDPLMVYCDDSLGRAICDCHMKYTPTPYAEEQANAHLIAAAPELLGLVKDFAYTFQDHPHLNHKRIAEIIAKAEGKAVPHESDGKEGVL